jgi:hypothetical protein
MGGIIILKALLDFSDSETVNNFMYRLTGTRDIDRVLDGSVLPENINFGIDEYLKTTQKYLIYK